MENKRAISSQSETRQPKLRKIGEIDPKNSETRKNKESPFSWSFYENPEDTYLISDQVRARMAWSSYHRSYIFYLGKLNRMNTVTVIRFSTYEALSIIDEVAQVLKEIDSQPKGNRSDLIPYFQNKTPGRAFQHEEQDVATFWKNADLILPSVRIRFGFNRVSGSYELHLHCPVSESLKREHLKNWIGPVQILNVQSMRLLNSYLERGLQMALFEPESDTDEVS